MKNMIKKTLVAVFVMGLVMVESVDIIAGYAAMQSVMEYKEEGYDKIKFEREGIGTYSIRVDNSTTCVTPFWYNWIW